ncbi:MAG: OmpA family protein [Paracoccus sp. (in: a-proteobacteria)]
MRRIIQNTTAIAACLSLMAPQVAMAQAETPEAEAQVEIQADAAEAQGAAEAAIEAVTETVEAVTGEACADGSEPPCAPAADDAAAVEAEATPVEQDAAAEEPAAEEPAVEAPAEEAAAEVEPAVETETLPGAEVITETPPVETPAIEPSSAEEEPAAEAETEMAAPEAGAAAVEAAAGAEPVTSETDANTEANAEPAAEAETPATATEEPAETDALEKALAEEAAMAESGAEAATAKAAASAEAKAEAPVTPTVSEAAKEAAAATAVTGAAALDAEAGQGEVTEEQVTEDNSRSSSEDFTAALQDALENRAAPQQEGTEAQASEDDDDNDLTKALLFGLGGLAVGAMLNNNRQVALSTPDRVVVTRADGTQQIIKDEVALLRQPGSTVATENFDDGSSRTIVTRADGSKVVTIRDADLRVLRRTLISADGTETRLIDDIGAEPVDVATLPAPAAAGTTAASQMNEADLRAALLAQTDAGRRFSLAQIRDIPQVRWLVPPIDIDAITFDTGSAAINPDQARNLSALGNVIREAVAGNPGEVFLIEAHTDTVGPDAANLALSDRRAESVALALAEYFDVPPENLVVQGYGEQFLKVNREGDVRENRRASVRRITGLLQQAAN